MPTPPLLFVYNADSGVLNALKDLWIKTVTPERYECQLCAVTYGPTGMKREWRSFVAGLATEALSANSAAGDGPATRVRFLHKDELAAMYGLTGVALPAAFMLVNGQPQPWLSAEQLNACRSLSDLKALVRANLPVGASARQGGPRVAGRVHP